MALAGGSDFEGDDASVATAQYTRQVGLAYFTASECSLSLLLFFQLIPMI